MDQLRFNRKKTAGSGFTLIEVVVALFILAVGLSSVAALLANIIGGTSRTEYMTQAATLTSEKLEDLNRYPPGDPNVAVTNGTIAGSITADTSASVTSNGVTETVNYMDEVFFSPTQGAVSETISGLDSSGNPSYTTTAYTPNGSITTSTTGNRASLTTGAIYFKRRWVIEANRPITGLRRITVFVFLENQSIAPNVSFQMTLVRP